MTAAPDEKKPGECDWSFAWRRVDELAAAIAPGDLVYAEPCPTDDDARVYAVRRGEAPGFPELRAELASRGIELRYEGAFYWRAHEVGS